MYHLKEKGKCNKPTMTRSAGDAREKEGENLRENLLIEFHNETTTIDRCSRICLKDNIIMKWNLIQYASLLMQGLITYL